MNRFASWISLNGDSVRECRCQWSFAFVWLRSILKGVFAQPLFSIPTARIYPELRRGDISSLPTFICSSALIAASGAPHVNDSWALWLPFHSFSGGIELFIALASLPATIFLVRFVPRAFKFSSPTELTTTSGQMKQQAVALKESDDRFRQMADNIQEIFWTLDPETKGVTYVSPAFEQIWERPIDSIYSDPGSYREFIHPEDRHRVLTGLENLEHTNSFAEDFRIICPSGTTKWLRSIGFVARDSAGNILTFVGTTHDITARKLIENELLESEDRYRDLVEHSSDLICTHNLQGWFSSINELPTKLLGYSRDELLNRPIRDFLAPETRTQFDEYLIDIKRDGFAEGLMTFVTKSGERKIWEFRNTLRTEGTSHPVVRGIAHDITEQKRAQEALQKTELQFGEILDHSPNLIFLKDVAGRYLFINSEYCKAFHCERGEIYGKTDPELFPADQATVFRGSDLAALKARAAFSFEEVAIHDDGPHTSIVQKFPLFDAQGEVYAICGFVTDITERKRNEERLREYEKAVEGVEEMIAVVDRDYRFLLANKAFVNFRHLQTEQVVGQLIPELVGENVFDKFVKPRLDESFEGNIVKHELNFTFPDLGRRYILVSYFPIANDAGFDRVVCVLQDITSRKHAEEDLRRLSGRILQLQDEERRRIARELHDSTGQDLVALATTLSQLHSSIPSSNRKLRRSASQCESIAVRCLHEVRTLSYLLHPAMLDETGLEDAIRHYVHGFSARTGIEVELEISPACGRMAPEIELALFRVAQESLTNIQRHSGSLSAKIGLGRRDGLVSLEISDNGHGLAEEAPPGNGDLPFDIGVGISSMRERVKLVGGQIHIKSSHSGTTVQVGVPVN
jgi:PAS domain S-box-containing protein